MSYCIAGIHTGIGKTVCSTIICQALGYDYWKPVQAGDLDHSDSIFVRDHVNNPLCKIHPERYRLLTAASPHYAAELENVEIRREDFILPTTQNNIVVETAGGLMSPLAAGFLNIDLVAHLDLPVILVSNNYLGSINHTLLTCEVLKARNIEVAGIVFSGESVAASEKFILEHTGLPHLFSIPKFENLDAASMQQFATKEHIRLHSYE